MHAIQVAHHGGPEVLEWVTLDDPDPGPHGLVVDLAAAGLNFIDVYHRRGLYPMTLPFTPGQEGAGIVRAVGSDVSGFAVGDAVAWTSVLGSYAEQVVVPAAAALPVPEGVGLDVAAAVMLQGVTAHYLASDTYPLQPGDRCLIHAGAGGVGLLLIQIAKRRGAEVYTTVGSDEKSQLATEAGADHVINYNDTDFGAAIESIAGPRPLAAVYDGVGQAVFSRSIELLCRRGMMITFGNASGPVDPVSPLDLMRGGSLFLTRPTLVDYIATREELERRCADLFGWIVDGSLQVRIGTRLPLAQAAEAHRLLEHRATTGKTLLEPATSGAA
jgi:NADPH2:quinone reductase